MNCSGPGSPAGRNGPRRCARFVSALGPMASGVSIGGPPAFPPPIAPKKMSSWRHTTPFGFPVVPPV